LSESPHLSSDLVTAIALIPFALAAFVITFGAFRALPAGRHAGSAYAGYLALGLEFFLAAGLIRLAGAQDFAMLGLVAAIIAARRVISLGIRYGARAAG
jgi:hypothetical protein